MVDWKRVWAKCLQIFIDQFLLISYIVAATIALAWPAPGKAVASVQVGVPRLRRRSSALVWERLPPRDLQPFFCSFM